MTARELTLDCDHVSKHQVHCNRYTVIDVYDVNMTVSTLINESEWRLDPETGETFCEDHK